MHTNACLIYRVPPQSYQPQFDSNPASLRVPKSAALAIPGPLPAPAPHPEQLESAGRYTQAQRWAGRGRQRGPGRGPAKRSGEALSRPR